MEFITSDTCSYVRTVISAILPIAAAFLLCATNSHAGTLTLVTTPAAQNANDSVDWSHLGENATILGASASATSGLGTDVTVGMAGPNSIIAVVCPSSPCSWGNGTGGSTPFSAVDSLIWTSDAAAGGNGPVTVTTASNVSGAGALIQADGPGQFTAKIQAFSGKTSLGSFTEKSDSNGDPVYIGVKSKSGSTINKVVFTITACTGICTDFAIDRLNLNSP